MAMPQCPRRCYDPDIYVERYKFRDTNMAEAYLCGACGTIFFVNIRVRPKSEVKRERIDKYGPDEGR